MIRKQTIGMEQKPQTASGVRQNYRNYTPNNVAASTDINKEIEVKIGKDALISGMRILGVE